MSKPREFWMDRTGLDSALDRCDLGDSHACTVTQYPHKDEIKHKVHVIEYSAYEKLKTEQQELATQCEKLASAVKLCVERCGNGFQSEDMLADYEAWKAGKG